MPIYLIHGLKVDSAWPLAPGIRTADPGSDGDANASAPRNFTVSPGATDWPNDGPKDREGFLTREAGHLLYWPIFGSVQLRPSGAVSVAPKAHAPKGIVPHAISGPIAAHWILMEGGLVLHANCVSVDGRALAIVGPSGAGKSSLAAALIARGASPHCDDVTSIDPTTGLVPFGAARVKLNPDVIAALTLSPLTITNIYEGLDKQSVEFEFPEELGPKPLKAIYRLRDGESGGQVECQELLGFPMAMAVLGEVYRPHIAVEAFGLESVLRRSSKLVGKARFFEFTRSRDLTHLDAIACKMLEHFRAL